MIVTYALTLRDTAKTISVPSLHTYTSEELLEHVLKHCFEHYNNSQSMEHYFLKDKKQIIILYMLP